MGKLKRLSLSKLNESSLDKKRQQLILGGNSCQCGSCGAWASTEANRSANHDGGITGTGTNDPVCTCSVPAVYSTAAL